MSERVTVLADGCFDPIHEGHIAYLDAAKALGNYLIVNTVTNEEVWRKRPTIGPLLSENSRLMVLRALRSVDKVVMMDTREALRTFKPNLYVKGKDWEGRLPVEETQLCQELGIEIRYVDTVQNSSTSLLKKFIQQFQHE